MTAEGALVLGRRAAGLVTLHPWPPPGAVLVAGPGAPWADTSETKP